VGVGLAEPVELDPQVVLHSLPVSLPVIPNLLGKAAEVGGHRRVGRVFVVGQFQGAEEVRWPVGE
jgi:hypothetical protein